MSYNFNTEIRMVTERERIITIIVFSDEIKIVLPNGDSAIIEEKDIDGFIGLLKIE